MENPPDVDDVLCNLASPEIRNKDDVLCNLASPEIMCNKDDENSTMTRAYSYNNVDPAFYSFTCTFDENDDDNEDVTEAKIKAFLEEKVFLCFWVVGPFIALRVLALHVDLDVI